MSSTGSPPSYSPETESYWAPVRPFKHTWSHISSHTASRTSQLSMRSVVHGCSDLPSPTLCVLSLCAPAPPASHWLTRLDTWMHASVVWARMSLESGQSAILFFRLSETTLCPTATWPWPAPPLPYQPSPWPSPRPSPLRPCLLLGRHLGLLLGRRLRRSHHECTGRIKGVSPIRLCPRHHTLREHPIQLL